MRYELEAVASELKDMVRAVATDPSINQAGLHDVLTFLSKVVHIIDQAYGDVYATLIKVKYFRPEQELEIREQLDLLLSRKRYRDAELICAQLHEINDQYHKQIKRIVEGAGSSNRWNELLNLIDERESVIIEMVRTSVREIQSYFEQGLTDQTVKKIRKVAGEKAEAIRTSLDELITLRSRILGISGGTGLLELLETNRSSMVREVNLTIGELTMGDKFENIHNATIINRSLVEKSFNKIKSDFDEDTANALKRVAAEIEKSGNREAAENFDSFNEELQKPEPKKSVLRALWGGVTDALPAILQMTDVATKISTLFGS